MPLARRIRAVPGIDQNKTPDVLRVGNAMYNGGEADKATYASLLGSLPGLLTLIQSCSAAQAAVPSRTVGAVATRNVARAALYQGIESGCAIVQTIADSMPARAVAIIENVGLKVVLFGPHPKPLLALELGPVSGSILCDANVGLLMGAGALKPYQTRFVNWQYTLDGSKTYVSAPPTTKGKTTIENLPVLGTVGVRVSLTTGEGPQPWSQVVTIIVH
jgi:hypothetical protein